jgi:photosystem II stability/assembly factor-like uncharacterized protein
MKIINNLAFLLFFQFLFSCNRSPAIPKASLLTDRLHIQKTDNTATANIVFRSADGGQTWQDISDAGFPGQAITDSPWRPIDPSNPAQDADSVWHPKEAVLPAQEYKTSIIQVGENFFCGHSDGIYRTSDKGKTWKLILPSLKGKMFKLSVSGNMIYAIQTESHC